jgi:hypothetical protein
MLALNLIDIYIGGGGVPFPDIDRGALPRCLGFTVLEIVLTD